MCRKATADEPVSRQGHRLAKKWAVVGRSLVGDEKKETKYRNESKKGKKRKEETKKRGMRTSAVTALMNQLFLSSGSVPSVMSHSHRRIAVCRKGGYHSRSQLAVDLQSQGSKIPLV